MKHCRPLRPFAAAAALALGTGAFAQSNEELAAQLRRLQAELQQVKGELEAVKRQSAAPAGAAAPSVVAAPVALPGAVDGGARPAAASVATQTASGMAEAAPGAAGPADAGSGVSLFGYGEMTYSRPRRDASAAVATVRRGVLGWAYRFNERTRFAAELEIENAVASAGDEGEVALEQFYVEHDLSQRVSARAGLFLLPVGYLNEVHEPTRYYGVNRNLVETAIIPTTWRELGLGFRGTTDIGLRWDVGAVTSFDLTKWDPSSDEGRESPLGSIHQEGQLAKARNLALYGALNYNGIPGFNVGGSVFTGGVGQKQPNFAAPDARVTLGEVHARWQPGKWDLSALAARGVLSHVAALNATFAGQPTPVPSRFGGWYTQAAYRVWRSGDYSLVPFVRYERVNTALAYAGLPQGLAPGIDADTRVWTVGASFYLHPQVVLKADYQSFSGNRALDRFNIGVGFHF